MLLLALIALLLWIGAGVALLHWKAKPSGTTFARAADRKLVPIGGNVRVSLQVSPPSRPASEAEAHDVVLLLDRSSSMRDGPGSALSAALRASENFVRRCPDQIRIGLISFNTEATVISAVTRDRDAVLRGLASISAGGGTSIDAAIAAAVELIDATPNRASHMTAVLLSDGGSGHALALEQASRLRERARLITVGFGEQCDSALLRALAGPTGHYYEVSDGNQLVELFNTLATLVTSDAMRGVIEEPASAPRPFHLAHTGTLHPIAVLGDRETTIAWSVPVMDTRAVSLSYDLLPEKAGWHPVARSGGRTVWRFPDGTEQVMAAPDGPRVLVLPAMLQWFWPILNPLFWLLFGKLFGRERVVPQVEIASEEPEPLTVPTLPAPLDAPQPALYESHVRPALIVGVGEAGEWAVTHLGHRLADRGIAGETVTLLALRTSFDAKGDDVRVGLFRLSDENRIEVRQDLRPYLESIRRGVPPRRRWIPVVEWLGQIGPRTTDWIHDRRQARLALLQQPDELEARIGAAIAALKRGSEDETALVVGSLLDPECSGMLAEVAHLLSAAGAQTTAIVSKPRVNDGRGAKEMDAFAHELERMLLMRGDEVLSDRHDPSASARQLLDRLVVLRHDETTPNDEGRATADVAWQLLAYADVLRRIPPAHPDAAQRHTECCAIEQTCTHLPVESLWRWVRARALARAVNGHWLDAKTVDNQVHISPPAHDSVAKWVNAFWLPSALPRPQGLLLRSGAGLIADSNDASMLALRARLPVDALYHEQAGFADRERKCAAHFLEAWAQALLDEANAQKRCGLPLLLVALREIEKGFVAIEKRLTGADPQFTSTASLGRALYGDLASYVERFRDSAESCLAAIAGNQLGLGIVTPREDSVCARIDRIRSDAEANVIFPSNSVREDAERRDEQWYQQYGAAFLDQLRIRFALSGPRPEIVVELSGKPVNGDLLEALEASFAPHRAEVLTWPLGDVLTPAAVDQPGQRVRVGAPSARLHPDVADAADERDPYVAATLLLDRVSLHGAIGVREAGVRQLPYAWPEEANAVRISALINNVLARRPLPFSPTVVHLLRDTRTMYAFIADLAEQRIFIRNGRCWLSRDGAEYFVGEPASTALPAAALANFQRMARQVAVLERSLDAQTIPVRRDPSTADAESIVALVEANPVVQTAAASEQWEMWRDVMRGVVLDIETQRRTAGAPESTAHVSS